MKQYRDEDVDIKWLDEDAVWDDVKKQLKLANDVPLGVRSYFEEVHKLVPQILNLQDQESFDELVEMVPGFLHALAEPDKRIGGPKRSTRQQPPTSQATIDLSHPDSSDPDDSGLSRQQILSHLFVLEGDKLVDGFRKEVLPGRCLLPSEVDQWIDVHADEHRVIDDGMPVERLFQDWRFPGIDPKGRIDYAAPDTILGRLRELAKVLTHSCPWMPNQAAWFILTGEGPLVPEIAGSPEPFSGALSWVRIRMLIDPVTAPEKVLAEYRRLRKGLIGQDLIRQINDRRLALVIFKLNTPAVTWEERRRMWNQLETVIVNEWEYNDPDRMKKHYHDTLERIKNEPPDSVFSHF